MTPEPKALLRAMSALLGLFGVGCLLAALAMSFAVLANFFRPEQRDVLPTIVMIMMIFFVFALAFYFLRVGYLGWFRLSPAAVEYVCGTWWLFIWGAVIHYFFIPPDKSAPSVGSALLGFVVSVGIYYAYRATTYYFTKKIFLAPSTAS